MSTRTGNQLRISCSLTGDGIPDQIFLETGFAHHAAIDLEQDNWALAALLYPAMLLGQDITMEGKVSARLLQALQTDLQSVYQAFQPGLSTVRIHANPAPFRRIAAAKKPTVALGFSGGIDSFASLALFGDPSLSDGVRVTHLAHLNVGHLSNDDDSSKRYRTGMQVWADFASHRNLDSFLVNSNMERLFGAAAHAGPIGVKNTQSIRPVAAALALGKGIDLYLHSSSFNYKTINARGSNNIGYADAISLPLLSTETMNFKLAGTSLSRVDKTRLILTVAEIENYLDVCVIQDGRRRNGMTAPNCGMCEKCVRTLLTLESLGAVDRFRETFDTDRYFRNRASLLRKVFRRAYAGDPSDLEAIQFARRQGVRLPHYIMPYIVAESALKKVVGRQ